MKHTLYITKPVLIVAFTLLLMMLVFVEVRVTAQAQAEQLSVSQAAISSYLDAQKNSSLSDADKIKAAIDAYFMLKYEGQKLLQAQDFSILIENSALDWVNKEKDKQEIMIYIATLYNSPYIKYNYTLAYVSISIDQNEAVVQLQESNEVVTKSDLIASQMGSLEHILILHKYGNAWKIYIDEYHDELSQGLMYQTKEELLHQVDDSYQLSQQQILYAMEDTETNTGAQSLFLVTYPYNRSLAYEYAHDYLNTLNPPSYLGLPQDCANFVSQAIYAGEGCVPEDTSCMGIGGNYTYDWYYVWDDSGSLPWVRVTNQFSFITGNTSRIGPYGSGTTVFCDANVGDVVQLKNSTTWFHEAIVVAKTSPCYGPQSIYIAAHTTNRWYYNLYNWTMYQIRFIRINGWRGN